MHNTDFLWVEKYRPQTVEDCILSEKIKKTFRQYVERKEIPNLLLVGGAGVGKTSIAKALCKDVGCDYLFINASDENGIDTLRTKITSYATSVSITGGRKVVILDEFDATTGNFQLAFRSFLELYAKNCTFIMTCNHANKIMEPIHSRCSVVNFGIDKGEKSKLLAQFFKRVCNILDLENIVYNKEVLANFITKYFPDNRRVLNELQRYSVNGSIDVGILTQVGDIQLKELIVYLKDKDITKIREWVVSSLDNDVSLIYRKIYDGMHSIVKPFHIPQLILLVGRYQFQSSFVADQEIQLMCFLLELANDVEFV